MLNVKTKAGSPRLKIGARFKTVLDDLHELHLRLNIPIFSMLVGYVAVRRCNKQPSRTSRPAVVTL